MSNQWVDPYAGFVYNEDQIEITAAHQAEKLAACGIDATVFGAQADPSFFIGLAIHAGIKSGITAEGNINMSQSVTQHRPVLLGESLRVNGSITAVEPVPRGRTLHTEVVFEDSDGQVVITANRVSLKPDPDKVGTKGAGEKPPALISDPAALVAEKSYQLTPDGIKAYSSEGNSIHYEMEPANKAGFRAPLIGGGMGVHYLMAALWRICAPVSFSAEIYFRRPIFWDEEVTVAMDNQAMPSVMALLKPEGKIGTELALHQLVAALD
jgi:hypothetical protein